MAQEVIVAAIREETEPEMDTRATRDAGVRVHWFSLGELARLIAMFHAEGVSKAVMAGQVKHKQIFSSIRPDWLLAKLLLSLSSRNTDGLLGAIAKVLQDEGIELISSTTFLEPLLARPGVLTKRRPQRDRTARYCVWSRRRERFGGVRHWPDGGDCGAGLRCRRGDGRHRRSDLACWRDHAIAG